MHDMHDGVLFLAGISGPDLRVSIKARAKKNHNRWLWLLINIYIYGNIDYIYFLANVVRDSIRKQSWYRNLSETKIGLRQKKDRT